MMLFTLKKCALQIESHFFKRFFYCSVAFNIEHKQDVFDLNSNDKPIPAEGGKKFLKVALVGLPNVGKSTLVNQLVRRTICPASSKVHTTRHTAEAIYSENDTQLVFMDTPGLVTNHEMKKFNLGDTFRKDLGLSVAEADVIGVIQDTTNVYTRHVIHDFIINYLKTRRANVPLLLILNKVDKLKKKNVLLDLARLLVNNQKSLKFDDIFMISAFTGDGVDDLRNYLVDLAMEKDWQYEKGTVTNQKVRTIIEETVRASAMDCLPHEVPYEIKVQLEHLDVGQDGTIKTLINLECNRGRYVKYLLANRGRNLKALATSAEQRLQHGFRTRVILLLNVTRPKQTKS